jgi:hypothetical protein
MRMNTVMSIALAASFLTVSMTLPAAEPALPTTAAQPRWHLICDSESGCSYWSDGKGQSGENTTGPHVYPKNIKIRTLELSVSDGVDDLSPLCTWQWKLFNGVWRWVCAR